MGAGKTITKLGEMVAVASTAKAIVEFLESREADDGNDFELDSGEHIKDMLDYLDGMALDIKEIRKQQNEHAERLKLLEERIDNVNNRVDNIVGDK